MTKRLVGMAMFLAVTALSVHLAAAAARAAKPSAAPLKYELAFEHPNTHLLDLTIHASDLKGATVEFAIPDWAPGSYYIENYSANVQRFRAISANGKALTWRKTDSQTWQIDLAGATAVTISYQVFANTLQNNHAQYNEEHAFIGGPSVWMYLVNGKDRAIDLSIAVPDNWKVATGMTHTSANNYHADSYDWFADSPLEISDFKEQTFEFAGTTYRVIDHDVIGQKDFTRFTGDLQKIVATLVPICSSVAGTPQQETPFKEYW